ncbi:copper-binding protein [Sphingomonas gilva]|uniref:Copper-binding protein n=1 Tax=Sphingomonas gilva TaxID=2305907 RepID=A0A396RVW0_9SPHN|nr:cupredoxin domain-containing protein [Sphingomonas gilva]RHW18603.1 copper-binding protein [Sphingomonas gilva]
MIGKALLIPFACALAAPVQAPETIAITLANFRYTPETIALRQGQPYVLRFTNAAKGGHDFVAREFFAAAGVAAEDRAKLEDGGIEVPGRTTVGIRLTAPPAGRYPVHCSHFLHSTFGMKGMIVVS